MIRKGLIALTIILFLPFVLPYILILLFTIAYLDN